MAYLRLPQYASKTIPTISKKNDFIFSSKIFSHMLVTQNLQRSFNYQGSQKIGRKLMNVQRRNNFQNPLNDVFPRRLLKIQSKVNDSELKSGKLPMVGFLTSKRPFSSGPRISQELFNLSEEVAQGFRDEKPVVALESTIITHGMPYPENLNTALAVEEIIREQGAIPATIAIIKGRISVGLTLAELSELAAGPAKGADTIKVSRRDLARTIAFRMNGGTTVSGTMVVASRVGIPVFVTGGIGGVHRNGETTMDVSADLTELGRTPVCVVSSGVKSILDIQRTLEYLETQGVCVATFGETADFPAFYTRKSGYKSPCNVSNPSDAAKMVKATFDLQLGSGLLIAVPVPQDFALEENLIQAAIDEALKKADREGIKGKEVTPFILAAVSQITKGKSLATNIALIKNNATVGAQTAVELNKISKASPFGREQQNGFLKKSKNCFDSSKRLNSTYSGQDNNSEIIEGKYDPLSGKDSSEDAERRLRHVCPVVIGGSNVDYTVKVAEENIKLDGSTHAARVTVSKGGVGRNLAACIHALGGRPILLTCGGLPATSSMKVISADQDASARYLAVLDSKGECKIGFGDMTAHSTITPEFIKENRLIIEKAPLIVIDGNIPENTMSAVLKLATDSKIPVFFEPTDSRKATKPFKTIYGKTISFLSPNLNELVSVALYLGYKNVPQPNQNDVSGILNIASFVSGYVDTLLLTMGKMGVIVIRGSNFDDPFYSIENSDIIYQNSSKEVQARLYGTEELHDVVNVSGAGDCLAAGFIAGMLQGFDERTCMSIAFQSATTTLYSNEAVPEIFFDHTHVCYYGKREFKALKM